MSRQDLTNMRFGRWTVMYKADSINPKTGRTYYKWHCKCDCGNEKDVRDCHLKSGKSTSCGCYSKELSSNQNLDNLIGLQFGRLTVLERTDNYISPKGRHLTRWHCMCECGNEIDVPAHKLKSGHTKSCGCYKKDCTSKIHKRYNDYEIQEDYVIMYTSKGEMFLVDLDDFWKVREFCWCKNNHGYLITRNKEGKIMLLSRFIKEHPIDMVVDHKHGSNTLNDNRKSNLRVATFEENSYNTTLRSNNTSGVTGVNWEKRRNKWQAYITVNKKRIYLGLFDNIEDAIRVRKEAESKFFGEYSHDNSRLQATESGAKKLTL